MTVESGSRAAARPAAGPLHGTRIPARAITLGVFLLFALLYLSRLAGYPLQDPDEGRYAEIPREMLASSDWITPHLSYVEYFEKPPLLYWLVAGAFRLLGATEGAARLAPALAALGTLVTTYAIGRHFLGTRAARLAVVILGTTPLFFVFSQVLVIDMVLTFLLTACVGTIWLLQADGDSQAWPIVAASTAALAVLAKGLVGLVLPGLVLAAATVTDGDRRALRLLARPAPIACFLAIAAPWFVVMAARHPEFLDEFFVREHLQRFATDAVGHPEGPLFYAPVLGGGALPWTLLAAVLAATRAGRAAWGSLPSDRRRFLLLWLATIVLFFSAARSKLAGYVVPALPPAALLLAGWIDGLRESSPCRMRPAKCACAGLLLLVGVALIIAGAALPLLAHALPRDVVPPSSVEMLPVRRSLLAGGCVAVAGGRWTLPFAGSVRPLGQTVLAVGATTGLVLYILIGVRGLVPSSRSVADAIGRVAHPGDVIVEYKTLMQGLSFYLRDRVVQVGDAGEIALGASRSSERARYFWGDLEELEDAWHSGRGMLVATTRQHLPELLQHLDPTPVLVADDGRRALLANGSRP